MTDFDLQTLYASVPMPPDGPGLRFGVRGLPGLAGVRLGRSALDRPAILFAVQAPASTQAPTVLRNLTVLHAVPCEVVEDGVTANVTCTVVACGGEGGLDGYFLFALGAIVNAMATPVRDNEVQATVEAFVELFRANDLEPLRSIRGLWGELFVIAKAAEPRRVLNAWHRHAADRYDFAEEAQRVEVKTCGRTVREHHFSLEQVSPGPLDVVVASIQVENSPAGLSVSDLVEQVARLATGPDQVATLLSGVGTALGSNWRDYLATFDDRLATESLRVFRAENVPSIQPPVPLGVSRVSFVADLSGTPHLAPAQIREMGGLIRAAFS